MNFFSFDGQDKTSFHGKIIPLPTGAFPVFLPLSSQPSSVEETREEYLKRIVKTISFVKNEHIPKLVISRRKIIKFSTLRLSETFLNLTKNYPNAFVYCWQQGAETWIGAFSELLGSYNRLTGEFKTMSLAGTLKTGEDWSEKEKHEQQTVTNYIIATLSKFSGNVHISDTYDHFSGTIKHLRTDLTAFIKSEDLEKLIEQLHPTPAVCGIPVELCKEAIKSIEKYPREYYAGYSQVELEDNVYYFVNLRCAKLFKDHAELFVGGGVTALSIPEKEWEETELKSQPIWKNLAADS